MIMNIDDEIVDDDEEVAVAKITIIGVGFQRKRRIGK